MELKDYLRILRRRWVSILLVALLVGGAAAAYAYTGTKKYASSVRLFVSSPSADANTSALTGVQTSQMSVQSFANLVGSRDLAAEVVKTTGIQLDPAVLAGKVKATVVPQTVNLTITVTDTDARRAQKLADGYAAKLVDLVKELTTPPGQKTAAIKASVFDSASYSATPVSPKKTQDIALGLVLGLLIGVGLAVLREVLDTRIRGIESLTAITDKPILGTIGFDSEAKHKPLISDISSHAPRAEAMRVLRTNLQFIDVDAKNKVFVLSSAVPAEGKTTTALNLAISLAQAGGKILLIEGDLRRPRAASRLGMDNAVGVTSVLVGKVSLEQAVQTHAATSLDFLASGPIPPNPAELLQSHAMHELVDQLRLIYDVVIIDAPPLLPVTDAALIASHADGAILVVRHGHTTRDQVKLAHDRLSHVDARLLGLVLNAAPSKTRGYGSEYGYGYGYGYAPDTETLSGARIPAMEIDQTAPAPTAAPKARPQRRASRRKAVPTDAVAPTAAPADVEADDAEPASFAPTHVASVREIRKAARRGARVHESVEPVPSAPEPEAAATEIESAVSADVSAHTLVRDDAPQPVQVQNQVEADALTSATEDRPRAARVSTPAIAPTDLDSGGFVPAHAASARKLRKAARRADAAKATVEGRRRRTNVQVDPPAIAPEPLPVGSGDPTDTRGR